jgi:hypothetical protein
VGDSPAALCLDDDLLRREPAAAEHGPTPERHHGAAEAEQDDGRDHE